MKKLLSLVFVALLFSGCTSLPVDPTPAQQVIANAAEDAISIGLVPVLANNPAYTASADAVASALGAFSGDDLTPEGVKAFLANPAFKLEEKDQTVIAGVVNAAWTAYKKRYAEKVSSSIRPDVKLFLAAVSNGIHAAVAATPKP